MSARAAAYANNAVAFVAWRYDAPIPNCLGFRIRRIDGEGNKEILPDWVGFQGTTSGQWQPKTTEVWPVQKFNWRDLTPKPGGTYTYEVTPMIGSPGSLQADDGNVLLTGPVRLTTE